MPDYGKREWHHYDVGDEVAGLVINAVLEQGDTQSSTRYWVRQTCCGAEGEWTHKSVRKRIRKGNTECAICTRRKVARQMGKGNRGRDIQAERAAQTAETIAVVIEHGQWAGRYPMLHPMGHRLGSRGADNLIWRGNE